MVAEAEKKNAKGKEKKPKEKPAKMSFYEELLLLQKQQINIQHDQDERHEKLMREMITEQRNMEREEREKDRGFFLALEKCFLKNKSLFM